MQFPLSPIADIPAEARAVGPVFLLTVSTAAAFLLQLVHTRSANLPQERETLKGKIHTVAYKGFLLPHTVMKQYCENLIESLS